MDNDLLCWFIETDTKSPSFEQMSHSSLIVIVGGKKPLQITGSKVEYFIDFQWHPTYQYI